MDSSKWHRWPGLRASLALAPWRYMPARYAAASAGPAARLCSRRSPLKPVHWTDLTAFGGRGSPFTRSMHMARNASDMNAKPAVATAQ